MHTTGRLRGSAQISFGMKFILKQLKWLVLLLVIVVGGGLFAAVWAIDSLAKKGIESGATYALGVPTTLGSAKVGIMGGTFAMSGLNVGNPQGFSAPHFLSLGEGAVAVSFSSLNKPTVELPTLTLSDLRVNIERRDGDANYKVILANLDKLKSGSTPSKPAKDERRFIIKELSIKNVNVKLDLLGGPAALGQLTTINVPIDEIKLQNVGKTGTGVSGTGVTMSELASIIVQAVLGAAADKGGGLIPADLLSDLQGRLAGLDGVKDMGLKVLGDTKGTIEEAGKKLVDDEKEKGIKTIEDTLDKGFKGLIPGKDKK